MSKKRFLPGLRHGHTELDTSDRPSRPLFPLTAPDSYGRNHKWRHTYHMPKWYVLKIKLKLFKKICPSLLMLQICLLNNKIKTT